jgi:hypothetical protein
VSGVQTGLAFFYAIGTGTGGIAGPLSLEDIAQPLTASDAGARPREARAAT